MAADKYIIPSHLDDPELIGLWTIDEFLAMVIPFVWGILSQHILIGVVLSGAGWWGLKKAKAGRATSGTVRISVCGRAVDHQAAMALMKRSPKITANCAFAMVHSRGGIFHSFSDRFKIR